jgi:RNA polymerase sigma factor (sigma-70 family)
MAGGDEVMASQAVTDRRWEQVEQHRRAALRLLGRTFPGLSDQHEDIFNEVATRLFERSREQGFWPEALHGYLLGAVAKNAAHKLRTARQRDTHPSDPQLGELAQLAGERVEERVLGELDAANYRSIIRSLNSRQRAVAKLRYDWGLSAGQIAELLEIDVQRCYRDLRRATTKIRRKARRIQAGEHVGDWERLFESYLAGTASAAQRAEARLLLDNSPQARSIAVAMYRQTSGLAQLLPVPPLAAAAGGGQGLRLVELLEAGRQHVTDGATAAKQHASAVMARVDVTPIAGARPGAATAAIIGCLAIGRGAATYCIDQNVNPLSSLPGVGGHEAKKTERPRAAQVEQVSPEPQPITVAPTEPVQVETTPVEKPPPPAPTPPPAQPESEPTPPAVAFGEPASAPPAATAAQTAQPAPAEDGGEFGP